MKNIPMLVYVSNSRVPFLVNNSNLAKESLFDTRYPSPSKSSVSGAMAQFRDLQSQNSEGVRPIEDALEFVRVDRMGLTGGNLFSQIFAKIWAAKRLGPFCGWKPWRK